MPVGAALAGTTKKHNKVPPIANPIFSGAEQIM
jgi:hypothetical protein